MPRATQPVLMLNGKYDVYFPLKSGQEPLYNLPEIAMRTARAR
jgi:hypothetical protein